MTGLPPSRRALGVLSVVGLGVLAGLGVVACSGGDSPTADGGTTSTTAADPGLEVPVYSNPAQVITVDVGRRFAIMVPADPAHGWRWVVEPVDTTYLAPLGSEFRDDPALLAQATTTTAPPEPPPTDGPGDSTDTTVEPTTTTGASTTTTAPGPLVQIISYAGRTDGLAKVRLRYEQIGGGESTEVLEFQVIIGTVVFPEPPDATDTTAG